MEFLGHVNERDRTDKLDLCGKIVDRRGKERQRKMCLERLEAEQTIIVMVTLSSSKRLMPDSFYCFSIHGIVNILIKKGISTVQYSRPISLLNCPGFASKQNHISTAKYSLSISLLIYCPGSTLKQNHMSTAYYFSALFHYLLSGICVKTEP